MMIISNKFSRKTKRRRWWINGGFLYVNQKVFDYLTEDDSLIFEQEPVQNLAKDGETILLFKHNGFGSLWIH